MPPSIPPGTSTQHDGSVLTGRTLDEIAEELPPKRDASPLKPRNSQGARKRRHAGDVGADAGHAHRASFLRSRLALRNQMGRRARARLDQGWRRSTLRSRAGQRSHPPISRIGLLARRASAPADAILDGEIVALDEHGHSDFERLQQRMHVRSPSPELLIAIPSPITCSIFSIAMAMICAKRPCSNAKNFLRRLLHPSDAFAFPITVRKMAKGYSIWRGRTASEGVVGKRLDSAYASGRSQNWVKLKATQDARRRHRRLDRASRQPAPFRLVAARISTKARKASLHRPRRQRIRRRERTKAVAAKLKKRATRSRSAPSTEFRKPMRKPSGRSRTSSRTCASADGRRNTSAAPGISGLAQRCKAARVPLGKRSRSRPNRRPEDRPRRARSGNRRQQC